MTKRKRPFNTSTVCASGPYCYLRDYRPVGGFWGGTPLRHETWQDAARCEAKAPSPIWNDRAPTVRP